MTKIGNLTHRYCLDTNAFIEPWNKYYSIESSPEYWQILDELAQKNIVFCTDQVKREIERNDDNLKEWLSKRSYFVKDETEKVQINVRKILAKFPHLISVGANRSMADPWVIAHAMSESATVVSKEIAVNPKQKTNKIKIPDVCKEFDVRCINDFVFNNEVGIKFKAGI